MEARRAFLKFESHAKLHGSLFLLRTEIYFACGLTVCKA
jgi:hypothetical protein